MAAKKPAAVAPLASSNHPPFPMTIEEEQPVATTARAETTVADHSGLSLKEEEREAKASSDEEKKNNAGQQTTNDCSTEDNAADKNDVNNDDDSVWKGPRDASKQLGDDAFRLGHYLDAVTHYTAAIDLDPDFAVAYSNRSACYLKLGEKSRALRDAEQCVTLHFGTKAHSRMAAALQSLGRWESASKEWRLVLVDEPTNVAALHGQEVCQMQLEQQQRKQQEREREVASTNPASSDPTSAADADKDDLDDFFDEVDDATREVAHQRQEQLDAISDEPQATNAIKHHKADLGTAQQQVDRLLQPNYKWRNLNPFYVLDVSHTASSDEISRRYKALSLLLHPDKNPGASPRLQDAYDQVKAAKAVLDDEHRASHCRQLVEQGMKQGTLDWERNNGGRSGSGGTGAGSATTAATSLQDAQSRAVHKIFAQIEHRRREVEERERSHAQRERDKEEEEADKERTARTFDKSWKKDERVEKRIGSWRHFQKKKPKL